MCVLCMAPLYVHVTHEVASGLVVFSKYIRSTFVCLGLAEPNPLGVVSKGCPLVSS